MSLDISPEEVNLADTVARSVSRQWTRVNADDVQAELRLWLCENHKYVLRWREEGSWGWNKLRASLRRRAHKFARGEFETMKPWTNDHEYTADAVQALLEALFAYADWSEIAGDSGSDVWASLADVSKAYESLSADDKLLLRLRFGDGLMFAEVADSFGLGTADAARMRVNRAVGRVAERASRSTVRWSRGRRLATRGQLARGEL